MFAQAGFNPRRTFVCHAFIMRHEWFPRFRASRLVRFASGEFAWDGGGGRISWPEQLYTIGCVRTDAAQSWLPRDLAWPLPCSALPRD